MCCCFSDSPDRLSHDNWKNRKRQTKLCIKYDKLFGQVPRTIQGHFKDGKLIGEAKIWVHKSNDVLMVTFVNGIPYGRLRLLLVFCALSIVSTEKTQVVTFLTSNSFSTYK